MRSSSRAPTRDPDFFLYIKIPRRAGIFNILQLNYLSHVHHCRAAAGAVKACFRFRCEFHDAVPAGIERIVFGAEDIVAWNVFRAALADDDLPDHDFLAVLHFDAQTLRERVAS